MPYTLTGKKIITSYIPDQPFGWVKKKKIKAA